MARLIYSSLWTIILPFALARLWWKGRKTKGYRQRWGERLGLVDAASLPDSPIWIHAVSVGETIAAAPLIERLLVDHPDIPLVISNMTPTGSAQARAMFGARVAHLYAPYDHPWCIKRFLKQVRPRALVVIETELWPNWIDECHRNNIPTILANGRLSAKSASGYAKVASITKPMLSKITWLAVQDADHARRFIELGAAEDRVMVTGSIKFDLKYIPELQDKAQQTRDLWGKRRPVVIAGSTHENEESLLLSTYRQLQKQFTDLVLVIAPRHPERCDSIIEQLRKTAFSWCRWSTPKELSEQTQIILVDTIGELMTFYAAADIAIVGGSFIAQGGHNPLEPASLAKPVIMGQHVFNFQDICDRLEAAGALHLVGNHELYQVLNHLLASFDERESMGHCGFKFVEANKGALLKLHNGLTHRLQLN